MRTRLYVSGLSYRRLSLDVHTSSPGRPYVFAQTSRPAKRAQQRRAERGKGSLHFSEKRNAEKVLARVISRDAAFFLESFFLYFFLCCFLSSFFFLSLSKIMLYSIFPANTSIITICLYFSPVLSKAVFFLTDFGRFVWSQRRKHLSLRMKNDGKG